MRWAEIIIEAPADSSEAITALLFEMGCHGVAERGNENRSISGFLPVSDQLSSFLDPMEARLGQLPEFGLSAPTDITLKYVEDTDCANEWKKYFKPLEKKKQLVIKPSWETYDADPSRFIVEIDPG